MSRIVQFQCFEYGRTIIREGHLGSAMYFILDGNITVSIRKWKWVIEIPFYKLKEDVINGIFYSSHKPGWTKQFLFWDQVSLSEKWHC